MTLFSLFTTEYENAELAGLVACVASDYVSVCCFLTFTESMKPDPRVTPSASSMPECGMVTAGDDTSSRRRSNAGRPPPPHHMQPPYQHQSGGCQQSQGYITSSHLYNNNNISSSSITSLQSSSSSAPGGRSEHNWQGGGEDWCNGCGFAVGCDRVSVRRELYHIACFKCCR